MPTPVSEKLLRIVKEINEQGNVNLTKLTVLKKWFEVSGRLATFGLWIARMAIANRGETSGEAAKLIKEARHLLGDAEGRGNEIDRKKAEELHTRFRDFQNETQHSQWAPIRIIHDWNMMLVEYGLDAYLRDSHSPTQGYKLAADYCQNYDSKYGSGLNGPSRGKIEEISRFVKNLETREGELATKPQYTPRQGQFLAFIRQYSVVNGCAPAEVDMERFFRISPPSVHQMVLTLERLGFIERTPYHARSIRLVIPHNDLPALQRRSS